MTSACRVSTNSASVRSLCVSPGAAAAPILAATLLVSLAIFLGTGCSKEEAETSRHEIIPISAAEEERGIDACTAYAERLCRCADSHPEYAEKCALIRTARLEALQMAIAASREATEDDRVRWRTALTARRLISRCIEEDNLLDLAICPR